MFICMDIFESETDSFSEMGTQDDNDIKDFLRVSAALEMSLCFQLRE